jgi:hypothetical protein
MTNSLKPLIISVAVIGLVGGMWASAADKDKSPIKDFMQQCHKAPKGTDPLCKKAQDGNATKEELKKLLDGYRVIAAAKPPRGEEASWKERTSKLVKAAEALSKGEADAAAKYKAAVNCKGCHSAHKGE